MGEKSVFRQFSVKIVFNDTTKDFKPLFNLQECVKNKTKLFNFWFVFNLLKETNEKRRKTEFGEKGGVGN